KNINKFDLNLSAKNLYEILYLKKISEIINYKDFDKIAFEKFIEDNKALIFSEKILNVSDPNTFETTFLLLNLNHNLSITEKDYIQKILSANGENDLYIKKNLEKILENVTNEDQLAVLLAYLFLGKDIEEKLSPSNIYKGNWMANFKNSK
ncbi:hypothetical protein ACW95P_04555, partial [Candidatus Mycoplasma pogonae]